MKLLSMILNFKFGDIQGFGEAKATKWRIKKSRLFPSLGEYKKKEKYVAKNRIRLFFFLAIQQTLVTSSDLNIGGFSKSDDRDDEANSQSRLS